MGPVAPVLDQTIDSAGAGFLRFQAPGLLGRIKREEMLRRTMSELGAGLIVDARAELDSTNLHYGG